MMRPFRAALDGYSSPTTSGWRDLPQNGIIATLARLAASPRDIDSRDAMDEPWPIAGVKEGGDGKNSATPKEPQ
jgi:hypothetical protein